MRHINKVLLSVEIADLVVVIWDDDGCREGTAIVLSGMMGMSQSEFSLTGPSTKKEISFLESPYRFMLSNNLSGTPKPLPGFTKAECEFDLSGKGLDSWRWLLIKKPSCTRWKHHTIRHTVKKSSSALRSHSLAALLYGAIVNPPPFGQGQFILGCGCSEWCKLINLLLGHTKLVANHPKARGPARVDTFVSQHAPAVPGRHNNCSFASLALTSCIPLEMMKADLAVPQVLSHDGDGNGAHAGRFDGFDETPHPLCSFVFITKKDVPDYVISSCLR